jgi:hypothetical protein
MTEATLTLCKEEHEKLLASGYVEINDPERGHMKVWLLFDELSPGIEGKHVRLKILRSGSAATQSAD